MFKRLVSKRPMLKHLVAATGIAGALLVAEAAGTPSSRTGSTVMWLAGGPPPAAESVADAPKQIVVEAGWHAAERAEVPDGAKAGSVDSAQPRISRQFTIDADE